ncbi:MAG: polyprenyl synthetase family protein [Bacteroides sp.]|nr:polyprenyl synthetase family protein [Bacteroides sp.]
MLYTSSQLLHSVNEYIHQLTYPQQPDNLYAPVRYILSLGGKRIRPLLALMSYNLFRDTIEKALPVAVALEIYHNFTLLHDDVMDHADVRRGAPTVHKKWNENIAILSGDAMQVIAYQHLIRCDREYVTPVMELFNRTVLEICEGQEDDLDFEGRMDVTVEQYIEMIRKKTAVLLACALKTGAILAGASGKDAELLYDFGIHIGLSFQLQDDLLDVYGDPKVFGKNIGGDILCNKKTFLLLKVFEMASPGQKQILARWLGKEEYVPAEKIEAIVSVYNELGLRQVSEKRMEEYYTKAMELLDSVSVESDRKSELIRMVEELMDRKL